MATTKQKLELTWIGKDEEVRLEPRILIEDPSKSYGDPNTSNMLIHGDNLLALKALEQNFAGKIKCIYIDPPYNTGNAFEHYDDYLEHSTWLNLMKPRIELLRSLLRDDGSIWISIDDDESHYLKVLCDEVFGRQNFVSNVIWEKKFSPQNDAKWLSDSHDHILVYARNKSVWKPNLLQRTEEMDSRYSNPDNDKRGVWTSSDLTVKRITERDIYPILSPSGKEFMPTSGRSWGVSKEKILELITDYRIWFGEKGTNMPRLKRFLSEVQEGAVSKTIWYRNEVGDNQESKREINVLFINDVFDTPKPERLIKRILDLSTKPGDWILDSFLGSGTTIATAQKMGRKWIGIELLDHCYTHCKVRMDKVIDGTDGLLLSKNLQWKGGGGYRFYELAASLLNKDKYGQWVISKKYNPDRLAAALCKHEGFTYSPDSEIFWKQGKGSENDYIFTTTNYITPQTLDSIHEDMKPEESLIIWCKAYQSACEGKFENITIKKIPQMLLGRCEFGKEDYSLNIINVPQLEAAPTEDISNDEDCSDEGLVTKPKNTKLSAQTTLL